MKILLVDVNCKESSTGSLVYSLYTHARARGHEAAVCYGRGSKVMEPNIYKFGLDGETVVHAGLTRLLGYTGCFSPLSTKRLIKFIDSFKPDVVHLHELHAYFVNIAPVINYLKRHNIKTVWTFHCEFMYTGKCGHAHECEKWKTGCGRCPSLKEYVATLYFDKTHRMWEQKRQLFVGWENLTIVTPSKWLADRVSESFLSTKDIRIINNGIDTDVFHPTKLVDLRENFGIAEGQKMVLAVGANLMSERKGGKYVLELAKAMPDYAFVLAGVDLALDDVSSNVTILPTVRDKRLLAALYTAASVFVICSTRETFSLVCAESLCCGTPIVGFKNGASEEISIPNYSSFVEYGDLEDLQNELLRMIDLDDETIARHASELYRFSRCANAYLSLYSESNES